VGLSYIVHISDADRAYLDALPFSEAGKQAIKDCIGYAIANVDDAFRNDPDNRLAPGAPYYVVQLILPDKAGITRVVRFIVNDSGASYGALVLVYVDYQ
jgi:hypothetical protein